VSLLVDQRAGSEELIEPLTKLGLPVEAVYLDFGDLAFQSSDSAGKVYDFGIEFKKIPDVVSSLRSGRLQGHQAPGMLGPKGMYDIGILLIEGEWATSSVGLLSQPHWEGKRRLWTPVPGQMHTSEFLKRLWTFQFTGGMHVLFSGDRRITLSVIDSLYRWGTDKPLDFHASLFSEYHPSGFLKLSDLRVTLKTIPGVGTHVSLAAERAFGSLRRAANATVTEWASLETRDKGGRTKRVGSKTAQRIVDYLTGRNNG